MQQADETLLSVIVLERGSSWPPWLAEYQKLAPDSIVIAQSSDESGFEFTRRIRRKMAEVSLRDASIHTGLLVSNGALDAESIATRENVCGALLKVMLQKHCGELVIAAGDTTAEAVRYELFNLAGRLCDELGGTEVSVRVRFGSMRPPSAGSGVMKSVASPAAEGAPPRAERASNSSR